jgi:hypothetical protein
LKKLGTFPASDIAPTRVQQSPAESSFRCNAIGVSDGAPPIAAECANVDERGGLAASEIARASRKNVLLQNWSVVAGT